MLNFSIVISLFCVLTWKCVASVYEEEKTKGYWDHVGEHELEVSLGKAELIQHQAKNAILFLGDGLGQSTITAARILKGQLDGKSGEETSLAMDTLPYIGLSKTYSVSAQTPDSSSTGTAFMTGVKTNNWVIGLTAAVNRGNCSAALEEENQLKSWLKEAQEQGKSIGVITTTSLVHATPAAAYAHSPFRFWADGVPPGVPCKDIAMQLFEQRNDFTVFLGGGRRHFRPDTVPDEEEPESMGRRRDGRNLIDEWVEGMSENGKYVWNKAQMDAVDVDNTDHLIGMFGYNYMDYEVDRDHETEPSIAEMTEKAIQILSKNPNGYAMLIEGGRIDQAHHSNNAYRALHDTIAFDEAIKHAIDVTKENDTLLMVTADHGNVMTLGGYSDRGNPIFGITVQDGEVQRALDGKRYTSLLYTSGTRAPQEDDHDDGSGDSCDVYERLDITGEESAHPDYIQEVIVPLMFGSTHGGEDVPVMARGPFSHLVTGVYEQTHIANVMRYAMCVGKYSGDACPHREVEEEEEEEEDEDDEDAGIVTNVAGFLASYFNALSGIFASIAGVDVDVPSTLAPYPEPEEDPHPTQETPLATMDYSSLYSAIYSQFSGFYHQSSNHENDEDTLM